MHLLIPFANCNSAECQHLRATLELPNLDKLLHKLPLAHTDAADETTLSPPHERALAAAYGISMPNSATTAWPDGQTPWGAWHAAQAGHAMASADAWAVITPCHWTVQTRHITMTHPRALNLGDEESRALLAAMQPYFAEDGIALVYDTPTRWLARGDVFAGLATASPYRVVGGHVDDWLPKSASAKLLRRLQNEMQMLLYTHPVNDARTARGLATVNSFWVSGTGRLPKSTISVRDALVEGRGSDKLGPNGVVVDTLREAALGNDWSAWAQRWVQLDQNECRVLLESSGSGDQLQLTLCGERNALRFEPAQDGMLNRLRRRFTRTTLQGLQDQL